MNYKPKDDIIKKENYIIYVGNVKPHKGLDILLDAFSKVKDKTLVLKILGERENFKIIYSRPNKALKESKYKNEIETRLYKIQAEKEHKRILKEMESYINDIYIN